MNDGLVKFKVVSCKSNTGRARTREKRIGHRKPPWLVLVISILTVIPLFGPRNVKGETPTHTCGEMEGQREKIVRLKLTSMHEWSDTKHHEKHLFININPSLFPTHIFPTTGPRRW